MRDDTQSPQPQAAFRGWRGPKPTREELANIDCYCGLGPACQYFRQMTPAERVACSRDKRQTAEAYWKGGMGH